LADRTHLSVANASQHLQNMRRAGVVTARRQGKFVFYRLADDAVLGLLASLRTVAERCSAELERIVRRYFSDKDGLEAVSRAELMKRLRAGTARVIDVRPEDEFALGHLPGAISVPLREIERRLCDLDPEGEIVAYCRGPYCVLAYEAVAWLRARGFNARRLEDGLPEWRAAGFPVEEGHPLPSAPSV
jgi:ArsR family transcriptional regulator